MKKKFESSEFNNDGTSERRSSNLIAFPILKRIQRLRAKNKIKEAQAILEEWFLPVK